MMPSLSDLIVTMFTNQRCAPVRPSNYVDECGVSIRSGGTLFGQNSEFEGKHRHVRTSELDPNCTDPTREMKPDTPGLHVHPLFWKTFSLLIYNSATSQVKDLRRH